MAEPAVSPARNLVWLDRSADGLAFLWHEAAPFARVLTIEALGPARCRLALELPGKLDMRAILPEELLLVPTADVPLAITRIVGSAVSPRVLAVGGALDAAWLDAVRHAARPDVLCLPSGMAPPRPFIVLDPVADLADFALAGAVFAGLEAMLPSLEEWLLRADIAARARRRMPRHAYAPADLFAPEGLQPATSDGGVPWRRTGIGRRCIVLVPGHGGREVRFSLQLRPDEMPPEANDVMIRVDGTEASLRIDGDAARLEATARVAPGAACHRLELHQARPSSMALTSLGIEVLA